eukprot:TRINITY_DN1603_c0_g1_i3.p1 TRINITY_DN1603_c0_g1~~TRINITY_DN1603_c0_g1_i3.p1  ORF type:complete len:189 (+),score=34.31 TRINITY_DN1603_c0_g1_i3:58-624(+)
MTLTMRKALLLSIAAILMGLASACSWSKKNEDDYVAAIMVFSILGIVFSLITVIVASLPLCCGIMKPIGTIIAVVAIVVGIISIFLPAVGGMVSGTGAVNQLCDSCAGGCSEQDKKNATDAMNALGILIAYLAAFGWAAIILGIVAAALGCCICCKCCKMKDDPVVPLVAAVAANAQPPVVVVGQVEK